MNSNYIPFLTVILGLIATFVFNYYFFYRDRKYKHQDYIDKKLLEKAEYSYVDKEIEKHEERSTAELNRRLSAIENTNNQIFTFLLNQKK